MGWRTQFTDISKWNNLSVLISCHCCAGRDRKGEPCYYSMPETKMVQFSFILALSPTGSHTVLVSRRRRRRRGRVDSATTESSNRVSRHDMT